LALDDPSSLSIRGRLAFLAKDSVMYGGAAAISKAFALVTFPLLARYFSVTEFGLVDFYLFLAALIATGFTFGQDSAVARYFYEYSEAPTRRQIISQSLALQMAVMLAVIPVLWINADWIGTKLSASPLAGDLIRLVLMQVPFIVLVGSARNILKWTSSRAPFLIVSLGNVAFNAGLLTAGIFWFELDVVGVFWVGLGSNLFFAALGIYFIRRWLVVPANLRFLGKLVPFAAPYGVIGFIAAFIPMMERSLVSELIGGYELGLYAAGAKVATLMALVNFAFQTGWGPFSLAIHKQPDASQTYSLVLKLFAVFICVAVLVLSAAGELVISILASQRFAGASVVVFPLAMAIAINATSAITEIGIGLSKKSYLSLFGYVALLASTAIGIIFLASPLGLAGVAVAVLIGQAVRGLIASFLAQRAYKLGWEYQGPVLVLGLTLMLGILGQWVSSTYGGQAATIVFGSGAGLVLVVGIPVSFSRQELAKISRQLRFF
jgi:O-antigen/teichoic acid export membrane protein